MKFFAPFAPLRDGAIALFVATLLNANSLHAESNWPQFRGPNGSGIAADGKPPIHFGLTTNLIWKTNLPPGNSSPCIWSDRIFLTAFADGKLETLCLDRRDGKILWRQTAPTEKTEPTHRLGNPATPTPATDGRRVYVYFGSFGLLAYDFAGKEVWRKPLATPVVEFGTSASPILAGEMVILVCDQDLGSYLLAVESATGKTIWKTDRAEFRRSFATPFVWRHGGGEELIVPGSLWLKSYNLKDGSERWTVRGTSRVACSSPVAGDEMLFSASWNVGGDASDRITMPSFDEFAAEHDTNKDGVLSRDEIPAGPIRDRFNQIDLNKDGLATPEEWKNMAEMFAKAGNALLAIRPGGRGDITATHVTWSSTRSLPYVSSPLFYEGRLYTMKNGGLASCYDAKTGKAFYQDERVGAPGDYYSSAVAAAGNIYVASQNGVIVVLGAGEKFEMLARTDFGEQIMATPAIVDGKIYVRTEKQLCAFGR
ncbi:MAG: PQQ-binding-like beta-propeller repeat protein [Verrucomicrobia bacterium]|nr:PQQ-binding-like beta-propeller repeat protein [Verrucomicrobiota bacterium]